MENNPAPQTKENPKKRIVFKVDPPVNVPVKEGVKPAKKQATQILTLDQLGDFIQFPPTDTETTEAAPSNVGYVLESGVREDAIVEWTKVLIKTKSGWTTAVIRQPSIVLPIGSTITYKAVPGTNKTGRAKIELENVVVVNNDSIVADLYRFLINPDNQSTANLKLMYLADISSALVQALPLKGGFKDFLRSQGIDYIVGSLAPNQFIVKTI